MKQIWPQQQKSPSISVPRKKNPHDDAQRASENNSFFSFQVQTRIPYSNSNSWQRKSPKHFHRSCLCYSGNRQAHYRRYDATWVLTFKFENSKNKRTVQQRKRVSMWSVSESNYRQHGFLSQPEKQKSPKQKKPFFEFFTTREACRLCHNPKLPDLHSRNVRWKRAPQQ